MKITWFGGTTLRIYAGGQIVVLDADGASAGIVQAELVSGADLVLGMEDATAVDPSIWRPRKGQRMLDAEDGAARVEAWRLGEGALVVDAPGEAPLLVLTEMLPEVGRWLGDAVVVIVGDAEMMVRVGRSVLEREPKLVALGGYEAAIDAAVPMLRGALEGTGLLALEAGMAVEV
jgi:hypothetical protein